MCLTGAEVELEGGQKLTAKLVILGDGVHSKSAAKYHKMPLRVMDIVGWRYVRSAMHQLKCHRTTDLYFTHASKSLRGQ